MKTPKSLLSILVVGAIIGINPSPRFVSEVATSPRTIAPHWAFPGAMARTSRATPYQIRQAIDRLAYHLKRVDRRALGASGPRCSYENARQRFEQEKKSLLDKVRGADAASAPNRGADRGLERELASLRATYARALSCLK